MCNLIWPRAALSFFLHHINAGCYIELIVFIVIVKVAVVNHVKLPSFFLCRCLYIILNHFKCACIKSLYHRKFSSYLPYQFWFSKFSVNGYQSKYYQNRLKSFRYKYVHDVPYRFMYIVKSQNINIQDIEIIYLCSTQYWLKIRTFQECT